MEYFINWPFGSKGHYHLPNGISPVLMDFLVRERLQNGENLVFVHDSWNVQGKYVDYEAISQLTGLKKEEIDKNYRNILDSRLPEIMKIGKEVANRNIQKSKEIKDSLRLLPSGIYRDGKLDTTFEFRDDSPDSWKVAQQKFLQLYKDDLIYWNKNLRNPEFFLDMKKLMEKVPLEKLIEGVHLPDFVLKQFRNAYNVYCRDMPLSTMRAYGTPVPLVISDKGLSSPSKGLPFESRYNEKEIIGPSVVIKPLFNCYFIQDVIKEKTKTSPTSIVTCNDQSLITRFNFPQTILTAYFGRDYSQKVFFNDLLIDSNGKRYSFKGDVLLSLKQLTEEGPGLARFLIARNTRFRGAQLRFEENKNSFKNLKKTVSHIKTERIFSQEDKRRIFSGMFKENITNLDEVYKTIADSGEICRALNFLTDYILQASKLEGKSLPNSVKRSINHLESILLPI